LIRTGHLRLSSLLLQISCRRLSHCPMKTCWHLRTPPGQRRLWPPRPYRRPPPPVPCLPSRSQGERSQGERPQPVNPPASRLPDQTSPTAQPASPSHSRPESVHRLPEPA